MLRSMTLLGARADPPLTFGELSTKRINLRMVTSNLSHSQPYHLPLSQNIFLFKEDDMRRLFPEPVVQYLIAQAYQPTRVSLAQLPGFHFLPAGDDLPVIVATRMSLSFPLLLSAVPLYTLSTTTYRKPQVSREDLQQNWFSDGGISSNFPIHLFDAWLPERPTFGITLTKLPPEALSKVPGDTFVRGEYTSAVSAEMGDEAGTGE